MKDYYAILGIQAQAGQAEIRQRYRLLVVQCHPDKFSRSEQKAEAEEKLKEINEAYETLKDPRKRARYDARRAAGNRPPRTSPPEPAGRPEAGQRVADSPPSGPLHYTFRGGYGDRVEVTLNRQANVILLDPTNYFLYQSGGNFRYIGGYAHVSPIVLPVPRLDVWHLVVDTGGYPGEVRASVRLIRNPATLW